MSLGANLSSLAQQQTNEIMQNMNKIITAMMDRVFIEHVSTEDVRYIIDNIRLPVL